MNMKLAKKFLTVTLAAVMVVMPITAAAATTESSSSSSSSSTTTTEAVVNTDVASTSSVAGITTGVAGAYSVKTLSGVAVRQSAAGIKSAYGLAANQTPFVRVYDITAKNSPAAFASINAAAASIGATVLGAINIDFGVLTDGKFSQLSADVVVPFTTGVANAGGRTLAVVKVLPGGAFEILEDTDTNANTVTVNMTGGLAAYAVVAY